VTDQCVYYRGLGQVMVHCINFAVAGCPLTTTEDLTNDALLLIVVLNHFLVYPAKDHLCT
jgi:hypothetical protein